MYWVSDEKDNFSIIKDGDFQFNKGIAIVIWVILFVNKKLLRWQ